MVAFRVKSRHILLKSKLEILTSKLLTIVTNIDSLLRNQYQEYIMVLRKARNNTLIILKETNITIYQDLTSYIIPFALFRIYEEYCHLANKSQLLLLCTQQFTTIMELLCVHKIEISLIFP